MRRPPKQTKTPRTVVFFHAHPDDEALLTGGTMARLAAEGHRVVLVTATAGEQGLASARIFQTWGLGLVRRAELADSARVLGCARAVVLGYRDSGSDPAGPQVAAGFAAQPVEAAARQLAALLVEESADALTIYDPAGGYGHPDHVQVHLVGRRAATLAGTPLVLQATVDRRLLQRALTAGRVLVPRQADFAAARFDRLYTAHEQITHRIDVRAYTGQKRAAMQAHRSQATADSGNLRGLAWMLRLPRPLFRLVFGYEWFVEDGRRPVEPPLDELLATLPSR